ncbi:MAG: DMT family transporter [Leptolyngbyaceae cyanobacterium T60_A2020_046]|nr:DMT family transporter [Leptolyngbyaceae cyanobacterium T60_A2020_046]
MVKPSSEHVPVSSIRLSVLTTLAMIAFAGNSLLSRAALGHTHIDAASFTTVRLLAGALMLWLVVRLRSSPPVNQGSWLSALALFVYAVGFSFAYLSLATATGALLLFGAVQMTMISYGLGQGERLQKRQIVGLMLSLSGLIGLLLPGLSAPPLAGALLMVTAGVAWGIYSLRGRGVGNPIQVSAGNFLRAVPLAVVASLLMLPSLSLDWVGIGYAVASGALASGLGYALWYSTLPALQATQAATVQLSVPVIAALGGIVFLGEAITWRLALASIAILGGIALIIRTQGSASSYG